MSYIVSPCKDCPKKGCGVYHAECEKYLEFDRRNKERQAKKEKERILDEYKREEAGKYFRRENRKGRFRSSVFR